MKRFAIASMLFAVAVAAAAVLSPGAASADEIKLVGVITKIDIAGPDATTATATLKDNKTGELVTVIVNDDLTLDKFKDHRIVVGRRDPAEVRGQGRQEHQQVFPQDGGMLKSGGPGESRAPAAKGRGA